MRQAEERPVRVLHISDIHRAPGAPTSNATLLGSLLDDIHQTYDDDNARLSPDEPQLGLPDLIVVSGDLTQHADEAEYEIALRFLEALLPIVNGDRRRVVLVPGNHDVNWAIAAQSYTPATKEEYERQAPPGEPFHQSVKRAPDGTYWRKNDATYPDRFKPFKVFFDQFYQGAHTYPLERESAFSVYDLSESLGMVVVGYNSCDEIDAYPRDGTPASLDRRAFINTDAIYNAEHSPAFHAGQTSLLRVAVFHHNIRSVDHGEDFLEPRYLQILKRHGFDMCLHGHVHIASNDLFDATRAKVLPVIGAGSLAAPYPDRPPAVPRGYGLVVVHRRSGGIWVHTRRHDENNLVWAADYQGEGKPYFVVRSPEHEYGRTGSAMS
jgi:3',5'-cyclic AMP phosphodiesterase CpdA